MLKFKTNGKDGEVNIFLPTSISELTPEYFKSVTDEIAIADNYSLIALCHKEKLSAFVMAGKSKKNQMNTAVVPILAKKGNTISSISQSSTNCFIYNAEIGNKLLISPTAMSLGLHVNVPMNTLTMSKFVDLIEYDNDAYKKAMILNADVFFVEYKIIANSEIIGAYKPELRSTFDNPFKIVKCDATDSENSI